MPKLNFQALGPIPLDPERLSAQFWYWKCRQPQKNNSNMFLEFNLKYSGIVLFKFNPNCPNQSIKLWEFAIILHVS